jgi:hypothetical protein
MTSEITVTITLEQFLALMWTLTWVVPTLIPNSNDYYSYIDRPMTAIFTFVALLPWIFIV